MELSIDSGEFGDNRLRLGRLGAQAKPRPVVDDSRQSTPVGCGADPFTEDLYARYWTNLVGYVSGILRDRHQAEEIAQEAMLRAWRHADSFSTDHGSMWGWLRRVAHNIMVDRMRYRQARPAEVEEAARESHAYAVADHSDDVVNSLYVADALARLQPAHRTVLLLIYYQRRTCAEAATFLGVPVGTVKSRLHYALREIRIVLEQDRAAHARVA
jgi:RNA polymerase sigma-70 factor (ECF subfamily)